jgi:dUTP pyrophosphatase
MSDDRKGDAEKCDEVKATQKRKIEASESDYIRTTMLPVLVGDNARLPLRGSRNAAGLDLYTPYDVTVIAGKVVKFPLNIAVAIPDGYYGRIETRSSFAQKGLMVMGGIIDSDYRGIINVLMFNTNQNEVYVDANGETQTINRDFVIPAGERCAQIIILKYEALEPTAVDTLPDTERGTGGFGSTGK